MAEVRYDYHEIAAAAEALGNVTDAYSGRKGSDVHDLLPHKNEVGHDGVAAALNDFGDRWDDQLDLMIRDCQDVSALLQHLVNHYVEWDEAGASTLRNRWWSRSEVATPTSTPSNH